MRRRTNVYMFTPQDKREITAAAHKQIDDSIEKYEAIYAIKKNAMRVVEDGLRAQKVFSRLTGLPFFKVWDPDTEVKRYNFESPAGKIKVQYVGFPNGHLCLNPNHASNVHADIYVKASGNEIVGRIDGWIYSEEFLSPPRGFEFWMPGYGPRRAVRERDLRPFSTLMDMIQ